MSTDRTVSAARAARRAAGYSLDQVATMAGRSVPTARAFELNEHGVSDEAAADLKPIYARFREQAQTALDD